MSGRKEQPLQWAGGYTLHLYCDHEHVGQKLGEFTGETLAECMKAARKAGWVIHKDRTATCLRHCKIWEKRQGK